MRLFGPTGVRQYPTDRSPATVAEGASATATANNVVTLASYTVPAGRRADVVAQVGSIITTVLAAGQTANAQVNTTPNLGGNKIQFAASFEAAAAVGKRGDTPSVHMLLQAGDLVQVTIFAAAGAGVILGSGGVQGVEYDA